MARPPLPLGTPGTITVVEEEPGSWVARCRFRDHDGVTRRLRKHGPSKTAAKAPCTSSSSSVSEANRGGSTLTPASRFREAAELYLAKVDRKREDSTHALYAYHLDRTVLPALGALQLRECTVARLDAFLEALEPRYAASTRRTLRSIVSGVLQIGVLHEALPANPVRELDRIEQPKGQAKKKPRGLTIDERQALLDWFDQDSDDDRVRRLQRVARAAELPDLVRFSLGTGLRIGEALAVRRLDVNLDGVPVRGQARPAARPGGHHRRQRDVGEGQGPRASRRQERSRPPRHPAPPVHRRPPPRATRAAGRGQLAAVPSSRPRRPHHLPLAVERAADPALRSRGGGPRLDDSAHLATHLRHHPRRRDHLHRPHEGRPHGSGRSS